MPTPHPAMVANKDVPLSTLYVTPLPELYCTGQVEPQLEVPAPNSRSANDFIRPFMSFHILRLFKRASDGESLKIEDIARAFPSQSATAIRKRMKEIATFERGGNDSGWWKKKPVNELKTEDELRANISPDMVCLYESMMAGHRKLIDLGLTKLSTPTGVAPIIDLMLKRLDLRSKKLAKIVSRDITGRAREKAVEEVVAKDAYSKALEYEIQVARYIYEQLLLTPWNLTGSYVECHLQGKASGMLKLGGIGDPTGRGEGFSFLREAQARGKNRKEIPGTVGSSNVSSTTMSMNVAAAAAASAEQDDGVVAPSRKKKNHQAPNANTHANTNAGAGAGANNSNNNQMNNSVTSHLNATETAVQKAVSAVTGTTADLRKLKMKEAGDVLRNLGMADADIKKLRRWDRIHMVRELSSRATAHGVAGSLAKFARGARKSLSAQQQEYRRKCDVIYERQMNVLSSDRVTFSSDEDEEDVEDEDELVELEKDLEEDILGGGLDEKNSERMAKRGPKNLFTKGGGGLNRTREALAERDDAAEFRRLMEEMKDDSSIGAPASVNAPAAAAPGAASTSNVSVLGSGTGGAGAASTSSTSSSSSAIKSKAHAPAFRPDVDAASLRRNLQESGMFGSNRASLGAMMGGSAASGNTMASSANSSRPTSIPASPKPSSTQQQQQPSNNNASLVATSSTSSSTATSTSTTSAAHVNANANAIAFTTNKNNNHINQSSRATGRAITASTSLTNEVKGIEKQPAREVLRRVSRIVQEDGTESCRIEFILDVKAIKKYRLEQHRKERARRQAIELQRKGKKFLFMNDEGEACSVRIPSTHSKGLMQSVAASASSTTPSSSTTLGGGGGLNASTSLKHSSSYGHGMAGFEDGVDDEELLKLKIRKDEVLDVLDDGGGEGHGKKNKVTVNISLLQEGVRKHQAEQKKKKLLEAKQQAELYKRPSALTSAKNRKVRLPLVHLNSCLEKVLYALRNEEESQMFRQPVDAELVPDYYEIVQDPVDLSTIQAKVEDFKFRSTQEFVLALEMMALNSRLYNGEASRSQITRDAYTLLNRAKDLLQLMDVEGEVTHLEKLTKRAGDYPVSMAARRMSRTSANAAAAVLPDESMASSTLNHPLLLLLPPPPSNLTHQNQSASTSIPSKQAS